MTGTMTESEEFFDIYKLVVSIPKSKNVKKDYNDQIYERKKKNMLQYQIRLLNVTIKVNLF